MLQVDKGLLYAAAQEGQYALEISAGGLFTTYFLQELQHAHAGNFTTVFDATLQKVRQASRQQQIPTVVGNTALGEALALGF
jgi:hypothetical protein